jgi:hypothetical protein
MKALHGLLTSYRLDSEHGAQENRKMWRYVEKDHQIHGECVLPPSPLYCIMRLSPRDVVEPIPREISSGAPSEIPREITIKLASSYDIVAGMVGIFQTVSAALTIYRSRGDQINRYGYAAFGLTVIPYALMSIINLIAGLMTPTYQSLYMVSSWEMEEAKAQHGRFDGVVGRVVENKTDDPGRPRWLKSRFWQELHLRIFKLCEGSMFVQLYNAYQHQLLAKLLAMLLAKLQLNAYQHQLLAKLLAKLQLNAYQLEPQLHATKRSRHPRVFGLLSTVIPMPLIIIYFLTHFDPGKSTGAQRSWIMCWLIFGISGSPFSLFEESHDPNYRIPFSKLRPGFLDDSHDLLLTRILAVLIFGIAAVGGMVTVGHMLMEYGTCELLPGE